MHALPGRAVESQPASGLLAAAAVAAVATAAVAAIPFARFAYDNPSLHVALETGEALVGLLLAFLAAARYRATGRATDLVLSGAFALLAATNLALAVGPNVALEDRAVGFFTWAAAGLRLLGAAGIATAAALGERIVLPSARRRIGVAGAGAVLVVLGLAVAADLGLGQPIDPTVTADVSNKPTFIAHELLLVIQGLGVVLYAFAAHRFARRANVRGPGQWLAIGCVLAAFSRVHYVLFSSLYTSWVSTGDVLRLASYAAFLIGAGIEIRSWWRAEGELAATHERGRIARDLHDGLAQELSFIRSATANAVTIDGTRARLVAEAAGRALIESRRLVRVLYDEHVAIDDALRDALVGVTRAGVEVDVAVSDPGGRGQDLAADVQAALVGVTREAGTNAARHGKASHLAVRIQLDDGGDGGILVVADDGAGFDCALPTDGFGLRGMWDRARAIGAELDVRSEHGSGTTVTFRW
ncbi:MAG: sensor histidine kinase [Acidimicrobiales bacterium]